MHVDKLASPNSLLIEGDEPLVQSQKVFPADKSVLSSFTSDEESLDIDVSAFIKMIQNADWTQLYVSLMHIQKQKTSFPIAFVVTDDQNQSVVHHALHKAPNALILLLLDVVTSYTVFGMNAGSPEVSAKQVLLCSDNNGNTPLHLACARLQVSSDSAGKTTIDFSVVKNLLLLGQQALGIQNNAGDTPFHLMLASDAFREPSAGIEKIVVEATLSILALAKHKLLCPLMVRNKLGYVPLHVCAKVNAPAVLTQAILESKASLTSVMKSKSGKTPLKLAMKTLMKIGNNPGVAGLRNALANVAALSTPEACVVLDAKKQTPLMNAVQNEKWSSALANILLSAHPKNASYATIKGMSEIVVTLNIRVIVRSHRFPYSRLIDLLFAYPAGVACLTRKRNTPLHFATKNGIRPIVKLLIQSYPKALQLRNAKGEWPIDRAIANNVDVKVIALCDQ